MNEGHPGHPSATPPPELGEPPAGHRWSALLQGDKLIWYPIPVAEDRPLMTEGDLSFHKACAGNRARDEQRRQASDDDALESLLEASAGPLILGEDLTLHPVNVGTLKTLRAVGSAFLAEDSVELLEDEICMAILVFSDARRVWLDLKADKRAHIQQQAEELAFRLDIDQLRRAATWINGQLLRLARLAGDDEPAPAEPAHPDSLGKPTASPDSGERPALRSIG